MGPSLINPILRKIGTKSKVKKITQKDNFKYSFQKNLKKNILNLISLIIVTEVGIYSSGHYLIKVDNLIENVFRESLFLEHMILFFLSIPCFSGPYFLLSYFYKKIKNSKFNFILLKRLFKYWNIFEDKIPDKINSAF